MNLGFQNRFIPFVEEGSKRHTIRSGSRWKAGMRADIFQNPRQKNMRLVFRAWVTKVEEIQISHGITPGKLEVQIDGVHLSRDEKLAFFWRDGFRPETGDPFDSQNMAAAFWHKQLDKRPFVGQVIHFDYENRFMDKRERMAA